MSDVIAVNLVKGRKPHFIDQFIGWALTVGRLLVILTETIALSAFVYRFGLDRQIIDLHDKITQEQNIVRFLQKDEIKFRNLQNRLQVANSALALETQTTKTYQDVLSFIPSDMILNIFDLSQTSLSLQADTKSVASIASLIDALKHYPNVTNVSLDRIENRTETGIIGISISAQIKKTETIQ